MAYGVKVWLIPAGRHTKKKRCSVPPRVATRLPLPLRPLTSQPAFTRIVYGVYESLDEAKNALRDL